MVTAQTGNTFIAEEDPSIFTFNVAGWTNADAFPTIGTIFRYPEVPGKHMPVFAVFKMLWRPLISLGLWNNNLLIVPDGRDDRL